MSTGFVCWDLEDEDEPGVEPPTHNCVDAEDIETAAEQYAERVHPGSDYPDDLTIKVRDPDGQTHTVQVTVEYSAEFYAWVRP